MDTKREVIIITVRLEKELHDKLTKLAEQEKRSLNSQITYILEKAVSK